MPDTLSRLEELSRLPERVTKLGDVDLVGREWQALEMRLAAIDQRPEVVQAWALMQEVVLERAEIREKVKALRDRYDKQIEAFAKKRCSALGVRCWAESALIQVKFTACNATVVDVVDPKTGVPFVVKHCPEAVEYEPKVRKTKFTKAFIEKVSAMSKTALARAGLAVVKPHDNVSISLRER